MQEAWASQCVSAPLSQDFASLSSLYGLFPLAANLGLHSAMSAVLCQDWTSVAVARPCGWFLEINSQVWIAADFLTSVYRVQRVHLRYIDCLVRLLPYLKESDEQIRRRGCSDQGAWGSAFTEDLNRSSWAGDSLRPC